MKTRSWDITTRAELEAVVQEIVVKTIGQNTRDTAMVLALSGDLGVGKTTFTQMLAATLGVADVVTSPTFVIMKKYQTTDQRFPSLVHIDAYRLQDPEELGVLGFHEELRDPRNLIVIEWAARVQTLIPDEAVRLDFVLSGDVRTLTINA